MPKRDSMPAVNNKRLEDDELFKQIGGQLDANFDYTQWQRKAETKPKLWKPHVRTASDDLFASFSVSSGHGHWLTKTLSSATPCEHGKTKKNIVKEAEEQVEAKQKAEHIKILKLRLHTRRQTLAEYKKREAELLLSNMKMKDDIIRVEKEAHEDVKQLLRKYERYRGGINTLNDQFGGEFAEAKKELEECKKKIDEEISVIQKQVEEFEEKLSEKQKHLHVLMNYKDKEYAVNSLRISELQTEIAELEACQQDELNDLQHMIDTAREKFVRAANEVRNNLTEKAAQEVLSKMHPSLKAMAVQNTAMVEEIKFHQNEISELEIKNKELEVMVKKLLRDPKTSIRQQMFPEFYPTMEKCTPDMEVVLDIPVQEWLPI